MAKKPTYEELEQRVKELEQALSERKHAEDELEKREATIQSVFDATPVGVCIMKNRLYQRVNREWCESFGYPEENLIGRTTEFLYESHEEYERVGKELYKNLPKKGIASVRARLKRSDGEFRDVDLIAKSLNPYDLEAGTVVVVHDITDQKKASEALRESEEKYRLLADNITDNIWTLDLEDLSFSYVSPSVVGITGYTAKEAAGFELPDILTPSSMKLATEILSEELSQESRNADPMRSRTLELEQYRKDGTTVWTEVSMRFIRDTEGRPSSILGVTRAITKRKQGEEALRESEEKYRLLIENIPSVSWVTNEDGKTIFISPNVKKIYDYSQEEIYEEGDDLWLGRIHPGDVEQVRQSFEMMFTNKEKYDVEYRIQRKDGEWIWLHDMAFLALEEDDIQYAYGIFSEITERKQAEGALQNEKNKLESIIDAMEYGLTIQDKEFNIIFQNRYMRELFGGIGKKCYEVYQGKEAICKDCLVEMAYNDGESHTAERQTVLPSGEIMFLENTANPIRDSKGEIVSCLEIVRNINERKRAEREMKEVEAQLQQAQKMEAIGTLAGGIAHDFNNILGGIMGYAELAKMKAPEESNVIADLDKLIKSSERAAALIKQILTISRQHKKEQRPVQVRYIVNEALNLLRATLPTTIVIREDLAKDAGIVNADPTQMHQVIMNLGTNAGHAMQEDGGVLEVSLANVELDDLSASKHLDLTANSYLRLTLSDTGHGMTSEIMERSFNPYFTTKDPGEGTGLGLSVAQGIVKAHGGTITVYSEMGKGTAFHVYLPVILEEEREEEKSEGPLPTGSERILFIDDEEVLVEIGGQMLEQLRYEVVRKRSSVQALELFRAEPDRFDLVITDMTMPDMTGDKLAQELMKVRPDIPVILCTGHSRLVSEDKAKAIGIKAFVMKPLVMRNLAETVRKVLDEK